MNLTKTSPKVVIHTHGCKLNQADSQVLARQFQQAGFTMVRSAAQADVVVLNSCTVTANSDSKARQYLRRVRRSNPDAPARPQAGFEWISRPRCSVRLPL